MPNTSSLYNLLKRPIVTEKSTALAQMSQYVFEVDKEANKIELAKAFELAFPGRKVTDVRVIKIPSRSKRFGRRQGQTPERRKAIFKITGEPLELFTGV
jgi:large subunit ribosomal protein L23